MSETPRRESLRSAIQCGVCETTFERQEHLTRHLRIHTSERPFTCSTCGKAFSRQDVLSRHVTTHNLDHREVLGASSRACRECAVSRVRCTRDKPCRRCSNKNLQCDYPIAQKRRAASEESLDDSLENRAASPVTMPAFTEDPTRHLTVGGQIEGTSQDHRVLLPGEAMGGASASNAAGWASGADSMHVLGLQSDGNLGDGGVNDFYNIAPVTATGLSSVNWLSPENQDIADWTSQLAGLPYGNIENDVTGSQFFFNIQMQPQVSDGIVYHQSISGDHTDPLGQNALGLPGARRPQSTHGPDTMSNSIDGASPAVGSATSASTDRSRKRKYYVEGAAARAPFQGRLTQDQDELNVLHTGNPADDFTTPTPSGSSHMDGSSAFSSSTDHVSALAYENLLRGLRVEVQAQDLVLDMNIFPSIMQIRHFVQLYFKRFHPTLPFLRRNHQFSEQPDHWILLLAVASVGAKYHQGPQGKQSRDLLSRLLRASFTHRFQNGDAEGAVDTWVPGMADAGAMHLDLPVLQAATLNVINMLHSGQNLATKQALFEKQYLVDACLEMDLLCSPASSSQPERLPSRRETLLQDWMDSQARLRTGMMIWLLDSVIAFEFKRNPSLKLGDVQTSLPCKEEVWDAPTTEQIANESTNAVTLLSAIEILYMEKKLPPNLSQFSTQILVYAICRRTKEAIYQHTIALSSWIPSAKIEKHSDSETREETWPPSLPILSKWRNSACDCLDILHWDANSMAARAGGWEHPIILHLHLSRLLVLAPVEHAQALTTALSYKDRIKSSDSARYARARHHLVQWAICDQHKARLTIIHAGALLWHVRRYSGGNFLEPFSIYLAIIVIWAYSVSVQSVRQQTGPEAQVPNAQSVFANDSVAGASSTEIPEGMSGDETDDSPEPSFIHLDRPCDDEMVQTYVRLGDRMSAYMSRVGNILDSGAPRKILHQGQRLVNRRREGTRGSISQGMRPDPSRHEQDEQASAWGIERTYAELLERLAQVT